MIRNRYSSAITDKPWWLAGGIAPDACIAAYQPVGASDYAASKVNLATPGLYDAVDGAAYPTWAAATGWTFVTASLQYLETGWALPTTQNKTGIARFTDAGNSAASLFGALDATGNYGLTAQIRNGSGSKFANGEAFSLAGNAWINGVAATSGNAGYVNGIRVAYPITDRNITYLTTCRIGRIQWSTGSLYWGGRIQAAAFYNIALTNAQVAALTIAMNAL